MSYQVLARKWRPRDFAHVVGQPHAVQALSNALNRQHLHHAYLFTGTRGVGKTTLARIIAKCLNCQQGTSAHPCGSCEHCQEIDAGRFIDLYEIDAASRTKVEDTRELLENIPYLPTKGRYKVYLIDEVHMLSGHSFNALLKTLEEPPEYVKFLFATTDHQRLPATILSRCLQFHLHALTIEEIAAHLQFILQQEKIQYDIPATVLLGKAAKGSVRDALSLLDQSIAFGNGQVTTTDVETMLGTLEPTTLYAILQAIAAKQTDNLLDNIDKLAMKGLDFSQALQDLLSLLHKITVLQLSQSKQEIDTELQTLAETLSPEDVQLYYQIALLGQRDLPFAPTPRIGFEMTLLRMLAFTPQTPKATIEHPAISTPTSQTAHHEASRTAPTETNVKWSDLLTQLGLKGMVLALAQQLNLHKQQGNHWQFQLHSQHKILYQEKYMTQIKEALSQKLNKPMVVAIEMVNDHIDTPASLAEQEQQNRQDAAQRAIYKDVNVQRIMQTFDATIIKESIMPIQ